MSRLVCVFLQSLSNVCHVILIKRFTHLSKRCYRSVICKSFINHLSLIWYSLWELRVNQICEECDMNSFFSHSFLTMYEIMSCWFSHQCHWHQRTWYDWTTRIQEEWFLRHNEDVLLLIYKTVNYNAWVSCLLINTIILVCIHLSIATDKRKKEMHLSRSHITIISTAHRATLWLWSQVFEFSLSWSSHHNEDVIMKNYNVETHLWEEKEWLSDVHKVRKQLTLYLWLL